MIIVVREYEERETKRIQRIIKTALSPRNIDNNDFSRELV